jgi:hypothetical protein
MNNAQARQLGSQREDMLIKLAAMLLLFAAAGWTGSSHAQGIFDQGRVSGTLTIGSGQALGDTYTTVGAGIGYMMAEGLMAGISGELWMGDGPDIQKITPEIRYTFTRVDRVKPYVGGFFTRTFYDGYEDTDSWGAKAGIYLPLSANVAMNFGAVYEQVMDCEESVYRDCSQLYPEVGVLVSF